MYAVESHCKEHSNGILKSRPGFVRSVFCFLCAITSGYSYPWAQDLSVLICAQQDASDARRPCLIDGHWQHLSHEILSNYGEYVVTNIITVIIGHLHRKQ